MKPTLGITLACLLGSALQPALAADADPGRACVGIADAHERLACYDAAYGRPAATTPASGVAAIPAASSAATPAVHPPAETGSAGRTAAAAAPPAESTAAAAARATEDFGLSEPELQKRHPAEAARQLKKLEAKVARVAKRPFGELILTLDNGQVWVQNDVDPMVRVRVGDTITISRAALGSFMLVTASGVATHVQRVR